MGTRWLVDLVGDIAAPSETFESAEKATPARVTVRLTDGSVLERELRIPVGAAGAHTRAAHPGLVRRKWLDNGGAEEVADLAAALDSGTAADVRRMLQGAFADI